MAISKEFFTDIITEQYMQVPTFLDQVDNDMSSLVENNSINLSDAGVEPEVYINETGDIGTESRTDVDVNLPLSTADSKNTVIRNVEALETSYDKAASVTRGHARAIMRKIAAYASFNYTPSSDGLYTPVLPTTGSASGGFKIITEDDLWLLKERYDDVDAPLERTLVLHDKHMNKLLQTSTTLKEQRKYLEKEVGRVSIKFLEFAGFKIYQFKNAAVFNKTTGVKKAFGAAAAPSTDTIASFSFVDSEVMKAFGDTTMFYKEKDTEKRGDIIGFQRRFACLTLRNKYVGAIYSAAE